MNDNFSKAEPLLADLYSMEKRARSESSKKTLRSAIETIEYLATALDDAELELDWFHRELD